MHDEPERAGRNRTNADPTDLVGDSFHHGIEAGRKGARQYRDAEPRLDREAEGLDVSAVLRRLGDP